MQVPKRWGSGGWGAAVFLDVTALCVPNLWMRRGNMSWSKPAVFNFECIRSDQLLAPVAPVRLANKEAKGLDSPPPS